MKEIHSHFRNDVNFAILLFLTRMSRIENKDQLIKMGLASEQIRRLKNLRIDVFHCLPAVFDQVFNIEIDVEKLNDALIIADIDTDIRALVFKLVEAGAPARLLRELFGLHRRDYCAVRRFLGLPGAPGRVPHSIDDQSVIHVWRSWQSNNCKPTPQRLLAVHEETGLPIYSVLKALDLAAKESCYG
ncbi:MAG TPA: DUF2857 family protein [Rhodobacteraceae bacterium]|nr:DUF2857 family protein [Paracoccaceae bacterium]